MVLADRLEVLECKGITEVAEVAEVASAALLPPHAAEQEAEQRELRSSRVSR